MPILAVDESLDEDCFGDGEEEGVDEDFEEGSTRLRRIMLQGSQC